MKSHFRTLIGIAIAALAVAFSHTAAASTMAFPAYAVAVAAPTSAEKQDLAASYQATADRIAIAPMTDLTAAPELGERLCTTIADSALIAADTTMHGTDAERQATARHDATASAT